MAQHTAHGACIKYYLDLKAKRNNMTCTSTVQNPSLGLALPHDDNPPTAAGPDACVPIFWAMGMTCTQTVHHLPSMLAFQCVSACCRFQTARPGVMPHMQLADAAHTMTGCRPWQQPYYLLHPNALTQLPTYAFNLYVPSLQSTCRSRR